MSIFFACDYDVMHISSPEDFNVTSVTYNVSSSPEADVSGDFPTFTFKFYN